MNVIQALEIRCNMLRCLNTLKPLYSDHYDLNKSLMQTINFIKTQKSCNWFIDRKDWLRHCPSGATLINWINKDAHLF